MFLCLIILLSSKQFARTHLQEDFTPPPMISIPVIGAQTDIKRIEAIALSIEKKFSYFETRASEIANLQDKKEKGNQTKAELADCKDFVDYQGRRFKDAYQTVSNAENIISSKRDEFIRRFARAPKDYAQEDLDRASRVKSKIPSDNTLLSTMCDKLSSINP